MRLSRTRHRLAALGLALAGLCGLQATVPAAADGGLQVTGAIALPDDDAYPEGMVLDPKTGSLYVTSFGTGAVYRTAPGAAKAEVFLPAGSDGRDHAMGTDIDRRGRLWVNDKAGVTLYETATGKRLARFATPAPAGSVLNDLDFAPDGTAYLTDSTLKVVYRLTETQVSEAVAAGGTARTLPVGFDLTGVVTPQPEGTLTLNGIEADPTGSHLLVVDSATGDLFRIGLASKAVTKVKVSGAGLVAGDGLLLEKNKLWVAHFGTDRISRVAISADGTTAVVEQQLGDPALQHPTTLIRKDGSLHVVRSQYGFATLDLPFTVGRLSGI
ncbi:SMP-30/gluconolactonase/LRE family protein [Streptomyces sp. NPDC052701]|uniref:SMP-30/gluconolactonase/LRE family protein n=1 Tax=Streptomyces sp. NPDC052701 TaxID=3155533 RepID=UPI00341AC026